jgi:FkbM family methyltransferase
MPPFPSRGMKKNIIKSLVDYYIRAFEMINKNYHAFSYKNYEFKFNYEDFRTFTEQRDVINGSVFGRENISISLFEHLDNYDTFIDIGAHFGIYSVICAKLNPDLQVHAFEPTEYNVHALKKNLERNGIQNNVCVHEKVVSNESGSVTFHQDLDFEGSTRDTLNPPSEANDEFDTIDIQSIRISEFLKENEYHAPFIKIDVEGAEDLILDDMITNYGDKVEGIIEVHSDRFEHGEDEVLDRLRNAGYELVCIKEKPRTNRAYHFTKKS